MYVRATLFFLLLFSVATAGHAQTVEPLPLTSNVIEGGAGGSEDIYFSFTAGPGDIVAVAEAMFAADATDATLTVDFLGVNDEGVASTLASEVVGRGRQRAEEALRRGVVDLLPESAAHAPVRRRTKVSAALDELQIVVLHLRAGTGIGSFKVRLDGPIDYAAAEEPIAPTPPDPFAEPQPEVLSQEEWDAAEGAAAATDPAGSTEIEVPMEEGAATEVTPELPPPTSEAKPPIRIPGRQAKTVRIPGKTTVATKPPAATPIRIKPVAITRVPAKTPVKIVKITKSSGATTTAPVENKKKPAVKLPVIVKKGTSK